MVGGYTHNAGDVGQHFVDVIRSFGFRSTHEGRALGEVIVENIVEGIRARTITEQQDRNRDPLPPNSDNPPGKGYLSRKKKKYGVELTNVRTGQMVGETSLRGQVEITNHLIRLRYGTAECPTRAANGAELTKQDRTTTDIEKAWWAEQTGRGFYGLDQQIADDNFSDVKEALDHHMSSPVR